MKKIPEYVPDFKFGASQFRKLEGKDIAILKVYPAYRHGWDDTIKKFRSAYKFPARLTQEVVYSGDQESKKQEGDTFFYREKFWDDKEKKFGFKKIKNDGTFFKLFKKVFDVDVVVNADQVTVEVWDGQIKQNVEVSLGGSVIATMQSFPASKIVGVLEALDLDAGVEMIDGKDKLGNPTKVRAYDWEETKVGELAGRVITFKARGTGIDTKYSYKEGTDFDLVETTQATKLASELTEAEIPF